MVRVLVGMDGSELARHAASTALGLLGDDVELTAVTVVAPPPPHVLGAGVVPVTPLPEATSEQATTALLRNAEAELVRAVGPLGVNARTQVLLGDAGAGLCRLAGDDHYDVVVIGSHGSGFLKRVLLGSVSNYVLHHAPCPVLVVRPPDHVSDPVQEAEPPP